MYLCINSIRFEHNHPQSPNQIHTTINNKFFMTEGGRRFVEPIGPKGRNKMRRIIQKRGAPEEELKA
jgi:hypothetical protein